MKIDPSRRQQRLSTGGCGNPADDRDGLPCHAAFAGVCDSLHGAAPAELSGGNPRGNNDDHDRNSNRCKKHRYSQRNAAGKEHLPRVSASSAPTRGLDKPIAIMRRWTRFGWWTAYLSRRNE